MRKQRTYGAVALIGGVFLAGLGVTPAVQAQGGLHIRSGHSAGYAARPLALPEGRLRVDVGPPDFGFMDHGELNNGRGFRVFVPEEGDAFVGLGIGAGYGVADNFEVGTLLLPLLLSPDFDFGDMEFYGRYAFQGGSWQLAAQVTMQLPTDTDFGLGLGIPALFELAGPIRVDTGAEVELIFADDARANLDLPIAFNFQLSPDAFVGPRTGLFFPDLEDIDINGGVQGGITVGQVVDLTASFNWPFLITSRDFLDTVNLNWFEIILGGTFYLDVSSS